MTLARAHEIGVLLAVSCAYLIVLLGGELYLGAWALLVAPWIAMELRRRERAAPASSGTLLAFASLGLGASVIAQRGIEAAVLAAGYALAGLLAARLLTRTEYRHDFQALVLSLLLTLSGSVLNVGLSYGVLFFMYGVAVVWSLTTRQLLASAERFAAEQTTLHLSVVRARTDIVTPAFLGVTALVAMTVLVSAGLIFVAFPRLNFGNLSLFGQSNGRFPTSVSLRGAPRASAGSSEVVARIRGVDRDDFERGLYLRGGVYDAVDEYGFSQLEPIPSIPPSMLRLGDGPTEAIYEVTLSPVAGSLLLTLGRYHDGTAIGGGRVNRNLKTEIVGNDLRGELHASSVLQTNFRYRLQGAIASAGYVPAHKSPTRTFDRQRGAALLAVPTDLDPRIPALGAQVTSGARNTEEEVLRLRTHLLSQYTYTLSQPNGDVDVPLRGFLFENPAGHCEYFATAFALLLRTRGIPSRVVGGYQGGIWDEEASLVVFQESHAHAWVEWFLDGVGWVVDDPTPTATSERATFTGFANLFEKIRRVWEDQVVDYSLQDQTRLLQTLGRGARAVTASWSWWKAGLPLAAGGLIWALLRWRRRHRRSSRGGVPGSQLLANALMQTIVRITQTPIPVGQTFREAIHTIPQERLAAAEWSALHDANALYEQARFGEARVSPEAVLAARGRLRAIAEPHAGGVLVKS